MLLLNANICLMKLNILLILSFSVLFINCKNNNQSVDKIDIDNTKIPLKDISELSYMEVYYALFTDNNGGFDAHGDLYGQGEISNVSIIEENSTCGKTLFLSNNSSENEITLAIKASFNLPGNPTHDMLRAYKLKQNEKISIGNSVLCYNGKEYAIKREIVSAGISNN